MGTRSRRPRRKDETTDTPTATARPGAPVTCADDPETGDSDADREPDADDDPDADWELMQDEGRYPSWL